MEQWIVVASEAVLSLYPILIKTVPTGLTTQLLSRFLTFSVAAAALAKPAALRETWGALKGLKRSLGLGGITLSHVAASYYAFAELPAGVAMSLFYTYPFWNLLGGSLFFGEAVSSYQLILMSVAFLGAVLVSLGSEENKEKPVRWKGVGAALVAAITETAMYFGVRTAKQPDPYFATLEFYPGALLVLLAYLGVQDATQGSQGSTQSPIDTRPSIWVPMTLFNLFIGFIGYSLRFYAIPKVSTIVFSLLSFVGVISAFLFGWLFVGEKPTLLAGIGAALISGAAAAIAKDGL